MNQINKPAVAAPSRLLSDFEIVQTLGSGAFGLVCKLRSKRDRKNYAVKVVPLLFDDSRDLREVQNLDKLPTHANVIMYYSSWRDCMSEDELDNVKGRLGLGVRVALGDTAYLFRMNRGQTHLDLLCIQMELCGEDLRKWLVKQKAVVESKSVQIFLQICAGLEHIHTHNLIHRDLKPENIFFAAGEPASVKIGDFGLAIGHTTQVSAMHTRRAGTPAYWAPEQESKKYSKQVDFYALGLILYELFEPSLQPRPRYNGGEPSYEPLLNGFNQLKFKSQLPGQLKTKWPKIANLIVDLVAVNPNERPNFSVIRGTISSSVIAPAPRLNAPPVKRTIALPKPLSPIAVGPVPLPRPRDAAVLKALPLIPRKQVISADKIIDAKGACNGVNVKAVPVPKPAQIPQRHQQEPVPVARPRLTDRKPERPPSPTQPPPPFPPPRRVIATPEAPPVPKQRILSRKLNKQPSQSDDEPCARCGKQILGGEKLVHALHRIWHPEHFVCAHCESPLKDGFFEKNGRAYCRKDYDDLYLPKCAACKKPIEKGLITVEGVDWHREHFCCSVCHKAIGGNSYYLQAGKAYCKPDYLKRFAPKCPGCKRVIEDKYIELTDKEPGNGGVDKQKWHVDCLTCAKCKKRIGGADEKAFSHEGKLYCGPDYLKLFAPRCVGCKKPIDGKHVVLKDDPRTWHNECFECAKCGNLIGDNYAMHQHKPICTKCKIADVRDKK